MTSAKVLLIIPYFGKLPEWFDLFLITCSYNTPFHWLICTDDKRPFTTPPNVTIRDQSFADFKKHVAQKLSLEEDDFPLTPYKLCDLKPFYGIIFSEDINEYKYWGFCDLDVLYGNLSSFFTEKILRRHSIISTHNDRLSGHFCILKNTEILNKSCFQTARWQEQLTHPKHIGIDEGDYSCVHFSFWRRFGWRKWQKYKNIYRKLMLHKIIDRTIYAEEQFTTPLTDIPWHDGTLLWDQPQEWVWENGRIYSKRDGHESPYLHFMNFKSSKWLRTGTAPWEGKPSIVQRNAFEDSISRMDVNPEGIFAQ